MTAINYVEYANKVRDVSNLLNTLKPNMPAFLGLVAAGEAARAEKFEWLEDSIDGFSSDITAFATTGDGTGLTLTSTTNLLAGSILRVTSTLGATKSEQMVVDSVTNSTDIVVTRDYGSTTGVTLLVGDIVKVVSAPVQKGSQFTEGLNFQSGSAFNYTQIFDTTAVVSATDIETAVYGGENAMDYQERQNLEQLLRQLNNAMIYGRKIARTSSAKGAMGGVLQMMEGGNVTDVSGAITSAVINDELEAIFDAGSTSSQFALMCTPNQARKISAFNTSGTNPVLNRDIADTRTGNYVTSFVGDLPVMGGNQVNIIVEPNFPKDQAAIIDLQKTSLHSLGSRSFSSKPVNLDSDGVSKRITGEYTFQMKNAGSAHALLTGLTL